MGRKSKAARGKIIGHESLCLPVKMDKDQGQKPVDRPGKWENGKSHEFHIQRSENTTGSSYSERTQKYANTQSRLTYNRYSNNQMRKAICS